MIVSHNPKQDRTFKTAALFMLGLMVAFIGLVTCHAFRPDANWNGPFGTVDYTKDPLTLRHLAALERRNAR